MKRVTSNKPISFRHHSLSLSLLLLSHSLSSSAKGEASLINRIGGDYNRRGVEEGGKGGRRGGWKS